MPWSRSVQVCVDDTIQIQRHLLDDAVQMGVVKRSVSNKSRQRDRSQVAHRRLVLVRVFDNLGAQVRTANGPNIHLIRFLVHVVLVQQERTTGLDLAFQDQVPQLLCTHHSDSAVRIMLQSPIKAVELVPIQFL